MKENTNAQTKKVVKVIFAWEDEKEEKWLEQEAAQGWHLTSAQPYVYYFKKGDPEKVVVRLDYKNTLDKDYQEYLALFRDAGWELVSQFSNWHYFRIKPKTDEVPEIYNSDRTKAQKYRRLLMAIIPIFPIFMVLFTRPTSSPLIEGNTVVGWIYFISKFFMAGILILWIIIIIKVIGKIKTLESHTKE